MGKINFNSAALDDYLPDNFIFFIFHNGLSVEYFFSNAAIDVFQQNFVIEKIKDDHVFILCIRQVNNQREWVRIGQLPFNFSIDKSVFIYKRQLKFSSFFASNANLLLKLDTNLNPQKDSLVLIPTSLNRLAITNNNFTVKTQITLASDFNINSMAYFEDLFFAVGSSNGRISIFSIKDFQEIQKSQFVKSSIIQLDFFSNEILICLYENKTIIIWKFLNPDPRDKVIVSQIYKASLVTFFTRYDINHYLIVQDGKLILWDVLTNTEKKVYDVEQEKIISVVISPFNNNQFVAIGEKTTILFQNNKIFSEFNQIQQKITKIVFLNFDSKKNPSSLLAFIQKNNIHICDEYFNIHYSFNLVNIVEDEESGKNFTDIVLMNDSIFVTNGSTVYKVVPKF